GGTGAAAASCARSSTTDPGTPSRACAGNRGRGPRLQARRDGGEGARGFEAGRRPRIDTARANQEGTAMSVDGTWHLKMQTPIGERSSTLTLSRSGSGLTGTLAAE